MTSPFMPKATAVWLIENTTLSFDQIAAFCEMHALEIQGIADGDVAIGVKGIDPVGLGQLTRDEIKRCEADPQLRLQLEKSVARTIERNKTANSRAMKYTPVARRENKPNAIAWLLKHCPEMLEKQIAKLVGSTTPTVASIKNRTHWNIINITAKDPVLLGICSQASLNEQWEKAKNELAQESIKQKTEKKLNENK
jgi:hypothetical protein